MNQKLQNKIIKTPKTSSAIILTALIFLLCFLGLSINTGINNTAWGEDFKFATSEISAQSDDLINEHIDPYNYQVDELIYNSFYQTPVVHVHNTKGIELTENEDYTLEVEAQHDVPEGDNMYQFKVVGTGDYSGDQFIGEWAIKPFDMAQYPLADWRPRPVTYNNQQYDITITTGSSRLPETDRLTIRYQTWASIGVPGKDVGTYTTDNNSEKNFVTETYSDGLNPTTGEITYARNYINCHSYSEIKIQAKSLDIVDYAEKVYDGNLLELKGSVLTEVDAEGFDYIYTTKSSNPGIYTYSEDEDEVTLKLIPYENTKLSNYIINHDVSLTIKAADSKIEGNNQTGDSLPIAGIVALLILSTLGICCTNYRMNHKTSK